MTTQVEENIFPRDSNPGLAGVPAEASNHALPLDRGSAMLAVSPYY